MYFSNSAILKIKLVKSSPIYTLLMKVEQDATIVEGNKEVFKML